MSAIQVINDALQAYSRAYMGLSPNEKIPYERMIEQIELMNELTKKLINQELSWTPTKAGLEEIKNKPRSSSKFIKE